MGDEPTRREGLLLSGVAGAVDGLGYLLLGVFTAHITGNTVHLGAALGRAQLAAAAHPAFAIAAFVAGVAAGAVARDACERRGLPARPVVFALCGALLAALLGAWTGLGGAEGARFYALAAPAALAMGCQNAVMPKVGGRRVRTYITGTMTELAEALVAAARRRGGERAAALARASELLGVWLAYLAGAVASGAAAARWGAAGVLLPLAGLGSAVLAELRRWRAAGPRAPEG
ncbi:DUF1275 family protein [Anaeromyxobacter diazotrophicus]|uniref:DUF1275 domain-containing protein n=1 Tax=Anaeromyxobacter diazotrophicus TaxID=2590199 RepID=A0A7I9VKL1_9BACT|nr:DUF1275 family protein [Anaeromyxobacter diazotrophicus]GEJ56954.1 hypothetical protein AMYX_16950 [Anaeromyxobacter diazotrophicus]